jgi:tellurite resistance-related uncharacterized protein
LIVASSLGSYLRHFGFAKRVLKASSLDWNDTTWEISCPESDWDLIMFSTMPWWKKTTMPGFTCQIIIAASIHTRMFVRFSVLHQGMRLTVTGSREALQSQKRSNPKNFANFSGNSILTEGRRLPFNRMDSANFAAFD